ncbi:MAG: rhodanese-like domain-containing protein [Candidatus Poribacteria bacterium]
MRYPFIAFIVFYLVSSLIACQSNKVSESLESKMTGYTTMSIEELHNALTNNNFLLINVHIPYAGEISGTNLLVPYNEIERNLDKLPSNKDAKIILYCRSGNMSSIAVKTMVKLGYTNVIDVPGGMNAWKSAGYEIFQRDM